MGWETAGLIESDDGNNLSPAIAMDANGNAIAMWTQQNGTQLDAWTNQYTVGVGWGTAAPIKTGNGSNYGYNLAMSANGDAIIVWIKWDSTRYSYSIWASRYVAGVGWSTAAPIESNDGDNSCCLYPQITMDASGNAIAVWEQSDIMQGQFHIVASRYTVGVGWGTVTPIGTVSLSDYSLMAWIAMNAGGDAIILWAPCTDNGSSCSLWASRYLAGGDWEQALTIRSVPNLYDIEIAMDAGGNAIALWTQCNDAACDQDSISGLWATRYVAGTGWSEAAQPIGTEAKAQFPDIAMDAAGNAIVVWTQGDSTPPNILASRYVADTGWETAALIETNDGNNSDPQIAMDANGHAVVVWTQFDGTLTNIWVNEFK